MEAKVIKISDNIYNTTYGVGDVFESSIIITMSQELFQKNIESITKDSIMSAVYRRSFMDSDLNIVTIEIPAPLINEVDKLYNSVERTMSQEYIIIKDEKFDLMDYLNKITIHVNGEETEYEVLKNSELGERIINLSGLGELGVKSNKEIIDMIKL